MWNLIEHCLRGKQLSCVNMKDTFFEKCPVCGSIMFTCYDGRKISAYCGCSFILTQDNFVNLISFTQQLGLIENLDYTIEVARLPLGRIAEVKNDKIIFNNTYIKIINDLDVGFDRVLFWVFVITHEFFHASIESYLRRKVKDLNEFFFETKRRLSFKDNDVIIEWIKRDIKSINKNLMHIRLNQEYEIRRFLANEFNSKYPSIYRAFLDVIKRIPPNLVIGTRQYLTFNELKGFKNEMPRRY